MFALLPIARTDIFPFAAASSLSSGIFIDFG